MVNTNRPQFCNVGFYNIDIENEFQKEKVQILPANYFNAKYKYIDLIAEDKKQSTKIPLISHDIWLTHPSSPKGISETNIEAIKSKVSIMDQANSNWSHIIWTNYPKSIQNENKNILEDIKVQIRDINEVEDQLTINHDLNCLIEMNLIGIASDYLRYKLLEIYGGFYSDINFILFKSPDAIMNKYDFFVQTQPNVPFIITPSMIAATKTHPIILATNKKVAENLAELLITKSSFPDCDNYNLTLMTSYIPFLVSFYKYSNADNTSAAFEPYIHDLYMFLENNSLATSNIENIMMDFNDEGYQCNNTLADKRFELFIARYLDYDVCIATTTIGVDIGEDSWNE